MPTEILKIAIAVDKWMCIVPLEWAISVWLKCDDLSDSQDLWTLMHAAYVFDAEVAFHSITRELVQRHVGSFLEPGKDTELEISAQLSFMTIRGKYSTGASLQLIIINNDSLTRGVEGQSLDEVNRKLVCRNDVGIRTL